MSEGTIIPQFDLRVTRNEDSDEHPFCLLTHGDFAYIGFNSAQEVSDWLAAIFPGRAVLWNV